MTRPQSVWQTVETDPDVCLALAANLGISPIIARMLVNRGIENRSTAQAFIDCVLADCPDPFLLKGMDVAVGQILEAIENGEKILIYGDYDVDGVTSTTLLLDVLEALGADVGFHIPDRIEEGYGLNLEALEKAYSQEYSLIITVDCGISAIDEVDHAAELGMDIIITDHHEPQKELPRALAIINPKQPNCSYPCKHLAGVGVAFKLAQGLLKRCDGVVDSTLETRLLDLVALGTIADIVPILDENRTLVKHGLNVLTETRRVGLKALLEVAGLEGKQLSPGHVGFTLAPRINATGRIGDAAIAVQLLRTTDELQARDMAVYLDGENRERQAIEGQILAEALEMLSGFSADEDRVIVLAREGWHPGVIGIVASRLVEKYYRPVIMIALEGEEGKGSCRSIAGFDLHEALTLHSNLMLRFGGHKQAAGLTIKSDQIGKLRSALNHYAASLDQEIYIPRLTIDAMVNLGELNEELVRQIKSLEPFGFGNPSPVLAAERLELVEAREVGKDKSHLKIKVRDQNRSVDGIGFSLVRLLHTVNSKSPVKVAFSPELNEYQGKISLQLQLKDMQNSEREMGNRVQLKDEILVQLTKHESETLQLLERGQSAEAVEGITPVFPVIAAINQALHTGLPSFLIYPLEELIDRALHNTVELIKTKDIKVQRTPFSSLDPDAKVVLMTAEFLAQNVAKLMDIKPGIIVVDSVKATLSELTEAPVLKTYTSGQLVHDYAPSRERLVKLYQALRQSAGVDGVIDHEQLRGLTASLKESPEFIASGLEIFEELDIVRQEKQHQKRIIYFRAPKQKLNLFDSGRFTAAQELIEAFDRLRGQCS